MMSDRQHHLAPIALLRQQTWLSPAFPTGSYSYSHGIEWAVEAGHIRDRESLVDWLEADVCHGSGRNEAIFFIEAWRCATKEDCEKLLEVAELAAAFRSTSEFALESSQQAAACLATLRHVWPDRVLESLSELLSERRIPPALAVVLGVRSARKGIPNSLALPAFLQNLCRQFGLCRRSPVPVSILSYLSEQYKLSTSYHFTDGADSKRRLRFNPDG